MDLIIHFVAYYLIGNVSGSVYLKEWEEFKRKHNKQYSASEDLMRQEIFQKKLAQVKKSLNDVKNGTSTHYLALNQFSDMV